MRSTKVGLFFVKFEVPQRQQLATRFKASTDCSTCPPVATVKLGNAYQFEKFGTGNRLLRYGRDIRYWKRPSGVPNASSKVR